jgi:hypothetical protein
VRNKMSKKADMVRHDRFTPLIPLYFLFHYATGLMINVFLNIP